jgi:hypothetical protein
MLECEAHLTGNNVVEADQFRGIVSAFDGKNYWGARRRGRR